MMGHGSPLGMRVTRVNTTQDLLSCRDRYVGTGWSTILAVTFQFPPLV